MKNYSMYLIKIILNVYDFVYIGTYMICNIKEV